MDNGWEASAEAWIADQDEHGDFGRRYILDPVILPRALAAAPRLALDLGCGEGRFCRMLRKNGVTVIGIDPTPTLIAAARRRDPPGAYARAGAEALPFPGETFDLLVSYLTLIDIPDIDRAIREAARVLRPGGSLLIANLTSINTAGLDCGWVKDDTGRRLHYPVDHYLQPRAVPVDYRGIRVVNHHRPLRDYFQPLLAAGLTLSFFDEPEPIPETPPAKAAAYRRVPWFLVMEWRKPRITP